MKKGFLTLGFSLSLIITVFFFSTALDALRLEPIAFPFILFLTTGTALGTIVLWKELKGARSKRLLTALSVWAVLLVVLFLFLLFF